MSLPVGLFQPGMSDFFAMGGHGAFIWGAYGVAVLGLGGLIALSLAARRRARREIAARGLERKR